MAETSERTSEGNPVLGQATNQEFTKIPMKLFQHETFL